MTTATTTIQISTANNELLNEVAALMREQHPELWGARGPARNAIVGYLAAEFLRSHEQLERAGAS